MTPEERKAELDRRTRDRMREIVSAGQMTQELLDALGLKGQPGFMGRGTYGSGERQPGYLAG